MWGGYAVGVMGRVYTLPLELMTAEAFAPFGEVLEARERPADRRLMFPADLRVDGAPTLNIIWQPTAGLRFTKLERHFGVTQTFFQLEGPPAVVAAAPPTDLDDPSALPDPGAVRGFIIDPAKGFAFKRGTWHSLDRYLARPPGGVFAIINVSPNPTQIVDYADGLSVTYADLGAERETARTVIRGVGGVEFEVPGTF